MKNSNKIVMKIHNRNNGMTIEINSPYYTKLDGIYGYLVVMGGIVYFMYSSMGETEYYEVDYMYVVE